MNLADDLLLDTNVLVHLLRRSQAGAWLERTWQLTQRPKRPLVSAISIGEILALGEKWGWGPRRRQQIHELLGQLTILDIRYKEILEAYGSLSTYWERAGQRMEQNDLWIAASAHALDSVLLTTDKDFQKLDRMIRVEWIDPEHLKSLGATRAEQRCQSEPGRLRVRDDIPSLLTIAKLRQMGYRVETRERTSGPITAIVFDREHGTMWGGASNFGEDYGIAW